MGRRRVRHPGGRSWLTANQNSRGEWSLWLEPEGLLVDSFHPGEPPHLHDPKDPASRIALGSLSCDDAERGVIAHLKANGAIHLPALVEELKVLGN